MSRKRLDRLQAIASAATDPAIGRQKQEAYQRVLLDQMRQASWHYSPPTFVSGGAMPSWIPSGPTAASKFSGSEFSMGTAVGVRSWNIDKLGRLESPQYQTVWTPGEMVATCKSRPIDRVLLGYDRPRPEAHQQSTCSCGFYAYYEGFNEYAQSDRVTGVIEGYGETQIGTRGFKSAKARIVALHVPDNTADIARIGKTPFQRVRENYGPHVAIFDDYTHMSAEFPTTQPEDAPTPETDPDFWTRGI